jgi:hypothetical protein
VEEITVTSETLVAWLAGFNGIDPTFATIFLTAMSSATGTFCVYISFLPTWRTRVRKNLLSGFDKVIYPALIDWSKEIICKVNEHKDSEVEPDISDYPFQMQAATGKGIPETAAEVLAGYQEWIEPADDLANVIVKNETPIAVKDGETVAAIKELTAVMKEPKPVYQVKPPRDTIYEPAGIIKPIESPQQALAELIETKAFIKKITPLPKFDNANSKWRTSTEVAEMLDVSEKTLSNLRATNECVNYKEPEFAGFVIGRDEDGLIWCKSSRTSKTIFYLFSEVEPRMKKKQKTKEK